MAEIMRSGIRAVGPGQRLAARALGLPDRQVMRWVVLPQALRIIIPPIGNQFISMLKLSALVSVIGVQELLLVADQTASGNFRYIETLSAAGIYYLVMTTLFMAIQSVIERHLRRRPGPRRVMLALSAGPKQPMTAAAQRCRVWKRFGSLEVLKDIDLAVLARDMPGDPWPVRFRQIDAAALPEPAGADRRRQHHFRRQRHRPHAARAGRRCSPAHGNGVPELRAVPAPVRRGQRRFRADPREADAAEAGAGTRP